MEQPEALSPTPTTQLAQAVARVPRGVTALLIVGLAPGALMLYFVTHYWVALPYWDEWATPGGLFASWCKSTLTLPELFSQHNESRKFFPRLLYLALAALGGWDVRKEMAICFASVCGIAWLFYRIMRQTAGATTTSALTAWIAAMFLCFSAVQFENFLWGIQLEPFFPGLAMLAIALVNTSQRSLAAKSLLNGILACVATYTFANGMLLWVLGAPIPSAVDPTPRRRLYLSYGAYGVAAALAIGAYFVGYQPPAHHPQMLPGNATTVALLHYLLLWIGSYFGSPLVHPLAVGIITAAVFAAALLTAVAVILRTRDWRTFYPAFVMAAYACITVGITALGRIGFGVEQGLDARYRTFSLFFYLATVALLFALYCRSGRRDGQRAFFLGSCSALAAIAFAAWIFCYIDRLRHQEILHTRNVTLLRALEWIDIIPDNPDLLLIYPIHDQLIERARILREHKLLRLPYPADNVIAQVQALPATTDDPGVGRLETCMFDTNHNLYITGWAKIPVRKHHADTIVIGCEDASGTFKPFSVMKTDPPRSKSGRRSKTPRMTFSRAFNPGNVPAGDITIAAWAVDMSGQKAYPLAGATIIRAEQR